MNAAFMLFLQQSCKVILITIQYQNIFTIILVDLYLYMLFLKNNFNFIFQLTIPPWPIYARNPLKWQKVMKIKKNEIEEDKKKDKKKIK